MPRMPKRFDRKAYIRETKFAPGIDPEAAAREAEAIHKKGKRVLRHKNKSRGFQKPAIK